MVGGTADVVVAVVSSATSALLEGGFSVRALNDERGATAGGGPFDLGATGGGGLGASAGLTDGAGCGSLDVVLDVVSTTSSAAERGGGGGGEDTAASSTASALAVVVAPWRASAGAGGGKSEGGGGEDSFVSACRAASPVFSGKSAVFSSASDVFSGASAVFSAAALPTSVSTAAEVLSAPTMTVLGVLLSSAEPVLYIHCVHVVCMRERVSDTRARKIQEQQKHRAKKTHPVKLAP